MSECRDGLPVRERRSVPGSDKKRSALAELDSAERGGVLDELLRSQPALWTAAERIAREQLADAEHEIVAEEVESELRSLSTDELSGRAGRQRWGYVEPTEAAWELLEETAGSYEREIERLACSSLRSRRRLVSSLAYVAARGARMAICCSRGRPTSPSNTPEGWSTSSPALGLTCRLSYLPTSRPGGRLRLPTAGC